MKRFITFRALIILIAIQLLIPTALITYNTIKINNIEKHGTEYLIPVKVVYSVSDGVFYYDINNYLNTCEMKNNFSEACSIAEIRCNDKGEYFLHFVEKPSGNYDYFKVNLLEQFTSYDSGVNKSPYLNSLFNKNKNSEAPKCMLVIKVYNHNYVFKDLYINGTPCKEWLEAYEEYVPNFSN